MSETMKHKGGCLCGTVRLRVESTSTSVGACHCRMCRKWGGGPLLALECRGELRIEGEENVGVFRSSEWAERAFCRRCGTHLFYRLTNGEGHAVPVGLLEEAPWVLDQQVFIDEKPAFYAFANETQDLTGEEVFARFTQSS